MIVEIEDAILARIKAAAADPLVLGWQLKTLESYGNQLDGKNLRQVAQSFPAVLVMFGGEPRPEEVGGRNTRHRPQFTIFLCQKNRRNEASARRGALTKVGTYQMVKDVRGLLSGQTLGLDMAPLMPGAVRTILQTKDASIYALELYASYDDNPRLVDAATLDDFSTFNSDWDLAPTDGVIAATDTLKNLEI